MKAIKIKDKDYLFIEVPFDAYNFHFKEMENGHKLIDYLRESKENGYSLYNLLFKHNHTFQITSTTKDISEEQAGSIVESHIYSIKLTTYRDYMFLHNSSDYENEFLFDYMTAKESLKSLIQANGLDVEKNYLILLKN